MRARFPVLALLSTLFFTSHTVAEDMAMGEAAYKQCAACHGQNAQGNQALKAPALAGQDAWYIQNQLEAFQKGYRGADPQDGFAAGMAAIAKGLNDNKINALAIYLNAKPTENKEKPSLGGDLVKGEQFYQSLCGSCHGPGGKGNKALNAPKLAGLNDWYIAEQINKFRKSQRGTHKEDRLGRQMKMMARILPDQQAINDVASFLAAQ